MPDPGSFPRESGSGHASVVPLQTPSKAAQRPPHERWEPVYSEEWGRALEAAHDRYMQRLWDAVNGISNDPDDAFDAFGESFCGCEVCERRASWGFLMTWIMDAMQEGVIELEERRWD